MLITLIVLGLTTTAVVFVFKAALNRDRMALRQQMKKQKSKYRPIETNEMSEIDEVTFAERKVAWKRVHADVFRSPSNPLLFSVILGTGF